jgi:hypothetical protein
MDGWSSLPSTAELGLPAAPALRACAWEANPRVRACVTDGRRLGRGTADGSSGSSSSSLSSKDFTSSSSDDDHAAAEDDAGPAANGDDHSEYVTSSGSSASSESSTGSGTSNSDDDDDDDDYRAAARRRGRGRGRGGAAAAPNGRLNLGRFAHQPVQHDQRAWDSNPELWGVRRSGRAVAPVQRVRCVIPCRGPRACGLTAERGVRPRSQLAETYVPDPTRPRSAGGNGKRQRTLSVLVVRKNGHHAHQRPLTRTHAHRRWIL